MLKPLYKVTLTDGYRQVSIRNQYPNVHEQVSFALCPSN